jgi:NMD protein affecting ribosome stability and mRNA decay
MIFKECDHKKIDYRPYRRGRNRCLECGAVFQLSPWMRKLIREWAEGIMTESYMVRILKRQKEMSAEKKRIAQVNQILVPLTYRDEDD